ncbi:MAG TPA: hypothetical protein VFT76_00210 [Actinomycetota bacterium]|nr:hypothetical protein [Actinomycetota bacterium]
MTRRDDRPAIVAREMVGVQRLARELDAAAAFVAEAYEELYEASLMPFGGDGLGAANRRGAPLSDPTASTATDGFHREMRWRVNRAAERLRRAAPHVAKALEEIGAGWDVLDPEIREKLRRIRDLEDALEAERESNPEGVTRSASAI